ncbi:ankyrin repeat domain-containing protein, partial [Alteromonas sp. W364]|uniref:ankyrin repeat domain-containing protein n=1 Tax=Alteromonas sp. W364 TaxID=3075610 RepID=UPI002887A4A3
VMTMKTDSYGRSALHYVPVDLPKSEQVGKIKALIKMGFDVNKEDNRGWTPLHFAAQENAVEATSELLRLGAKVDLKDYFGNTALFRAVFCSRGKGDIIQLLLRAGSDPDLENNHGVSPRKLASTIGNFDVKQFFENA